MMRNICVFCGSSSGFDRRFEDAAARLADVLADNDCVLFYGGGSIGLMNVIADRMLRILSPAAFCKPSLIIFIP